MEIIRQDLVSNSWIGYIIQALELGDDRRGFAIRDANFLVPMTPSWVAIREGVGGHQGRQQKRRENGE